MRRHRDLGNFADIETVMEDDDSGNSGIECTPWKNKRRGRSRKTAEN